MKLSELIQYNFEAGEFFRGCQNLPNYPDLPFPPGTLANYHVGDITVSVLTSSLMPFEETCLVQSEEKGRKIYDVLRTVKFYYIVVIGTDGIDSAYVPDEIFINEATATSFTSQHLSDLVKFKAA